MIANPNLKSSSMKFFLRVIFLLFLISNIRFHQWFALMRCFCRCDSISFCVHAKLKESSKFVFVILLFDCLLLSFSHAIRAIVWKYLLQQYFEMIHQSKANCWSLNCPSWEEFSLGFSCDRTIINEFYSLSHKNNLSKWSKLKIYGWKMWNYLNFRFHYWRNYQRKFQSFNYV